MGKLAEKIVHSKACSALFVLLALGSALAAQDGAAGDAKKSVDASVEWKPLFKPTSLDGWIKTSFGGEGDVTMKDGILTLHIGSPMTGVTYDRLDFPKENYEMRWEAQRVSGQDFFAGVTFPVGDEYCSFIGGGWGGSLTGLSSINGYDASENDTTGFEDFKNNKWYAFRIRVDKEHVIAWINDREVANVEREGNGFSIRIEMSDCEPLGYCTYDCTAEIRNWEFRKLEGPKAATPPKPVSVDDKDTRKGAAQFIRIDSDAAGEPRALQTTVSSYEIIAGAYSGAKIDLIGAVHVAEKSYYDQLNKQFESYESLLYELVADPSVRLDTGKKDRGVYNPLSAIQVGMKDGLKLAFQLDEIDYKRKNFVHADMTPEEFMADMRKRDDSFVSMFARVLGSSLAAQASESAAGADAKLLAALLAKKQHLALRKVMAEQFENMDIQLAGIADRTGRSTLVTERNAKALAVMKRELERGKRHLGIFYGAAHLNDMDQRLIEEFQAERRQTQWLDAWLLKDVN